MLLVAKRAQVRYGGTFLVAVGVYPCSAMIMVSGEVAGQEILSPGLSITVLLVRNANFSLFHRAGCRTTSRPTTSVQLG